jgi:metal-responsive CopG/Arc/MetJ family transcriptional regulator
MKNHKIAITMPHDAFSMLEGIISKQGYAARSKSNEIAWLISQKWERLQEQEREKTPAELLENIKAYVSRIEKKAKVKESDFVAPCHDKRIIQFPVSGSALKVDLA